MEKLELINIILTGSLWVFAFVFWTLTFVCAMVEDWKDKGFAFGVGGWILFILSMIFKNFH